jgi:CubicO group peptidase (beta-lactamase class C family)
MKETLSKHVGAGRVPGLVALVSHYGETHALALGSKSYGGGEVRRDTIFGISSMTKPVTAASTMALSTKER